MTRRYGKERRLHEKAHEAGLAAMAKKQPTPMVVQEHENMADDSSPVVKSYLVKGGVCGFAWVNIKPGNCRFANFLKKEGIVEGRSYYGGVTYWCSLGGQSYELKCAYCGAYARVLREAGIRASMMSRFD